jgi:hypothetical protein
MKDSEMEITDIKRNDVDACRAYYVKAKHERGGITPDEWRMMMRLQDSEKLKDLTDAFADEKWTVIQ